MGQKEPICYGQELARKSHQDSAVGFVTAKRGPERASKTRQYDLLWPNVGLKEPPRLGSTICYGETWARKSHQDLAVRFVTAKTWPEGAIKTRQYDLLRPRVGQKEPPRLGSTMCYGQTWARKNHQDSAVRFVTAKRGPERATETRQYDLLRQTWARKSHGDSAVRFDTAKSCPERATKTRQYDMLRPRIVQKEQPRLGSTIRYGKEFGSTTCYGQEWARKSHQDSAVRFGTAKHGPERATKTRQYDLLRPERATKTRQYDLLRPIVGQKEPARLGSTICYGRTWDRKSHQDSAVRFVVAKRVPEKATKTRQYDLLSHQDCPEKAATTRQYDSLRPRAGKKEPLRIGSTICSGQTWARKSHQDSAIRFVSAKCGPERATKTRQYDLLRPRIGQKEPPRLGSTICYGQELARKSRQDAAVRLVTAKRGPERVTETRQYDLLRPRVWPERATKTRQYDLLRPRVGQKEPPRLGSTICYSQELRATNTRQCDLLRPIVGQKKPPRLGGTICYGKDLSRKSHQDSAVRFVTAKRVPERATKTRQYDLLRPRVGQKEPPYDLLRPRVVKKEPPRLGSTICCGQTCARKSHQHSAVRFVTAKRRPERATKTR